MSSTLNIQLTDAFRKYVDERASDKDVYTTPGEYLFDDIISTGDQRRRDFEPDCRGCLEIDDQLHFCRLLDWQIGRPFAP